MQVSRQPIDEAYEKLKRLSQAAAILRVQYAEDITSAA